MRWNTRTRTQLKHVCTLWAICNFDIDLCLECNNKVLPAGGAIKASIGLQLHTLCCIPLLSPFTHNPLCFLSAQTGSWRGFDWLYYTNRWWWRHGSRLVSSGDIISWHHDVTLLLAPPLSPVAPPFCLDLLFPSQVSSVCAATLRPAVSLPTTFSTRHPFSEIWTRLRLTAASVFGVIHMFCPAWRRSSCWTKG